MNTNNGVQLGSVKDVTNISPASRSASSMFKMTRARPSIIPEETGRPTIVFVFSKAYDLVVQFNCAYNFAKFFKSEIVYISVRCSPIILILGEIFYLGRTFFGATNLKTAVS